MPLVLPTVSRSFRADLLGFIEAMPATRLIGLQVVGFAHGVSVIELAVRPEITFDGKTVQGGIVGTLADYAAVSAATAAMPDGWASATTGFEVHNLEPARGEKLIAIGRAIKAGKGAALGAADVFAVNGDTSTLAMTALASCRLFEVK